jgi:hypothetical protein
MIENGDVETARKAKIALEKLNANNLLNRYMVENPRITAISIQSATATAHIVQAGISDAVVVALSSLASGALFEIKDALSTGSNVDGITRVRRLLKKVLDDFYATFKRGASYGALDTAVGILSQIFKSLASKIKAIWKSLRSAAKSVYNAIYDFITGKVKTYKELLSIILKGLLSAIIISGSVILETKLEAFLSSVVTPAVASYLAPAITIVVGAIAVVISMKSIDAVLNMLFGLFSKAELARMKAEKVREICDEMLPKLIEDTERLEKLIEKTYKERKLKLEMSFNEFQKGLSSNDADTVFQALESINNLYGKTLTFHTMKEFDDAMLDENFTFVL